MYPNTLNDFHIWQTLLQTAVVGSGKASLPPPLLDYLRGKGLDTQAPEEEILLEAAVLTSLRIKAGRAFPTCEGPFPEPLPARTEVINAIAARSLTLILNGPFGPALPEWLELFAKEDMALPPESLPGLLDRCVEDNIARSWIEPHLGERARWLIAQNPAWASLSAIQALDREPKPVPGWTENQARAWIAELQFLLASTSNEAWNWWDYRDKFREAAFLVPPLPDAPWLGGWEYVSPRNQFFWKNDIDYFLEAVHFRIEMHQAFF